MKNAQLRVLFSWLLLLCFTAGQYMVYSHQHRTRVCSIEVIKKPLQHKVSERCDLCDAMHHMVMLPGAALHPPLISSTDYTWFIAVYADFEPIGLILASGRAPPVV